MSPKLQHKFYSAVLKGDGSALATIIKNNKIDINIPIGDTTPLIYSARNNHTDTSEVLLQAGANPNEIENTGTSALRWASYRKNQELINLLLKYNADPNLQNARNGATALHIASKQNDIETVDKLLKAGAKVTLKQEDGKTAIDLAKEFNACSELNLLLKEAQELESNRRTNFRKYCKTNNKPIK